ncbi:MAG: ArnT family glycosyltransferase, partial [Haloarculaceae archaeon]
SVAASARGLSRFHFALTVISLAAGVAVIAFAVDLFPYHSLNHDEGVYLQQAALLLEGKLQWRPPVPGAVRPWFFVREGGRLYSKYSPVAPAMFAPGLAVGAPRLVLGAVAAGNAALVGLLGRAAFDDRTGILAAALLVTAPLFLLSSAVFLSYAPTTLLNLLFAVAYVRAVRKQSRGAALLAGAAIGLAFFSRPFTAVLFALPFVAHALVLLAGAWNVRERVAGTVRERVTGAVWRADSPDGGRSPDPWGRTLRLGSVAAVGAAFVVLALAYNRLLTGDPLVFPYQAFAPEDGIGFGHRGILNYERVYTPALALRANGRVVWQFLARWGPLGPLGSALAAVGLAAGLVAPFVRRAVATGRSTKTAPTAAESTGDSDSAGASPDDHDEYDGMGQERPGDDPDPRELPDLSLRALLAGVAVSVVFGNVLFWGNLNLLAAMDDPTDGLIAHLGPFYHFDVLLPASVFAAAGAVTLADAVRGALGGVASPRLRRVALAALLVASLVGAGGVEAGALGPPVERNAAYTDDVAAAYAPFESASFADALVFVPTPYGGWLNHPFQWLRNDPALSGDAVYVMDRGASGDAASLDAFPERTPYRFTYRGDWPPEGAFTPVVERLDLRSGERLRIETETGVVVGAQSATVRLEAGGESVQYGVERLSGPSETVTWVVGDGRARVLPRGLHRYSDAASVPVEGPTTVSLSVTYVQPGGSTITYRQELTVTATGGTVRALWPPEERVCRLTTDCGREGTYLRGGDYASGVELRSSVAAVPENGTGGE